MFDQLLQAYPEVHPEDLATFGVLQEQPTTSGVSQGVGEVAGVLANMVGGRNTLVTEIFAIIHRIARLDRADPMRATEKLALVAVIRRERLATLTVVPPHLPRETSGTGTRALGAQGGPRPPPGFVDLTDDNDDEMLDTPASPFPHVSDYEMEMDDEADLLASPGHRNNDSSDSYDGFQHV